MSMNWETKNRQRDRKLYRRRHGMKVVGTKVRLLHNLALIRSEKAAKERAQQTNRSQVPDLDEYYASERDPEGYDPLLWRDKDERR